LYYAGIRTWKTLRLLYSEIPEGGLRIAFRGEDAPWDGLKGFSIEAAPWGHLHVQRRGRDVFVEGEVHTTLSFECSRCLERFRYPVDTTVRQMLRPEKNDRVEAREIELNPQDLEYGCYRGDTIPLESVIEEQVLLALPMQPLCREDCKGLCPNCGANRNQLDCSCREATRKCPFDSLKKFVVQER